MLRVSLVLVVAAACERAIPSPPPPAPPDAPPTPRDVCDDIVIVTVPNGAWIGQRTRRCFHAAPYEAWVRSELDGLRNTSPRACSLSIEIATLEKEPFDQVIRVIDIIKELGFERFNVVHPDSALIPAAQLAAADPNPSCANQPRVP